MQLSKIIKNMHHNTGGLATLLTSVGLIISISSMSHAASIETPEKLDAIQSPAGAPQNPIIDDQNNASSANTIELEHIDKPAKKNNNCKVEASTENTVDKIRSRMHTNLCNSASWIDERFGKEHQFDGENFLGKISLGFRQDEDDGFDPRLRVRIKTELPNVSNRFNAFIGRVEEDSFISNTEVDQDRVNSVGLRSTNDDESEWLVGLGYRNPDKADNGIDYSIGAKLSSGISPYAKATYHYLIASNKAHYWRTTQTAFWRRDEGFGVSSNLDYTHIAGDYDIIEWDTNIKYTEEAEQFEWITSTTWHHEFSKTTGVSSRAYVRGEEENPVSIPEYGVTFTYVRPFLRDWLFVETGVDFRWEKLTPESSYKSAVRFGLQFEMLLGDYYSRY